MSSTTLASVLKSCSEGELINEASECTMTPKQLEGSRLKRTFTLPRNPFGTAKPNTAKSKSNTIDNKPSSASSVTAVSPKDEGVFERKLFRRPSWKRFLNKIAHHMSTVNVPGVKSGPVILNGERVPSCGEPPWPPGLTPAATGIKNHGNTCYMNAVIQCLSHTDVIAEYFVLDHYKVDLQKRNKINSKKYGTRGEVTEQLAVLLKALWACRYNPDMSTAFKSAVERHGNQYRGNSQHDAQEFLFWLLDKVHEDLNTATKKKYKTIKNTRGKSDEVVAAETLANHSRRNSSFVQTVFQAQYRSALTCAKCERTSCTFDPFHCVSVQLPPRQPSAQPSPLPVNVVYVNQQPRQVRIGVELAPAATMDDLRATLHADTGIDIENIILAEINETGWCVARAGWEGAGADAGALYCVEAPPLLQPPPAPYLLLLWVNLLDGERFGSPYALQVPREVSYPDLQKLMLKEMCLVLAERVLEAAQGSHIFRARLAEAHRPRDPAYLQPELPHPLFSLAVEQALCAHDTHPHLRLELLWDPAHRDSIIRDPRESCSVHVSAAAAEARSRGAGAGAGAAPLTLHGCLQHYTGAERLAQEDAWRCPQCQRHMPVVKTLGLWSLPDVLVIHLKRFRQQAKGRSSTKLTTMVEFPLTDLDMSPHVTPRAAGHAGHAGHAYDLFAVCYHHGDDLETGHYTAACRNPYDNRWYKFDDARVTPVDDERAQEELVDNTAYMLFYRRQRPVAGAPAAHWALRMPRAAPTDLPELVEEPAPEPEPSDSSEPAPAAPDQQPPAPPEQSPARRRPLTVDGTTEPYIHKNGGTEPYIHKDGGTEPYIHKNGGTELYIHKDGGTEPYIHKNGGTEPYIHKDGGTEPYIHKNGGTEPYIHKDGGTEPYIHKDGGTESYIHRDGGTEPYIHKDGGTEPYIHKDVHVNPKMTPVDARRPRSAESPAPLGSVSALEYRPTTEDLVLSMFQETQYRVPRHTNHMPPDAHRQGEKSSVWKTRIST